MPDRDRDRDRRRRKGNNNNTITAPVNQGVYSSVPTYEYSSFIKSPTQMGSTSDRSWKHYDKNIQIASDYTEFIMSDQNNVTTTGNALGMNYLLDTNTQCSATDLSGNSVERYTYIQSNIPGGMLDSIISDIENGFSANNLVLAFTPSINCQQVTLSTIDQNGMNGFGTEWVATSEISNINPCQFQNGVNPVTNQSCGESFVNYSDTKYDNNFIYDNKKKKNKDAIESIYLTGIMVFGLYLVYCFMKKTK
jgi:hypothetical protein